MALFVALSLANGSNYLFHVVVSRLLGPSAYGALTALLSGFLILSIPASAVQVTIARMVAARARDSSSGAALPRGADRQLWFVGIVVAAVIAGASPIVASFLHLSGVTAALLLAVYAVPTFPAAVYQGGLQGNMRFGRLASAVMIGTGLRLGIGIALVEAGYGVTGAVAASVIAQFSLLGIAWLLLRDGIGTEADAPRTPVLRECAWSMIGLTGFWVMASLDAIFARHYLSAHDSGLYGASVTLSRSVLFASGAIALIAFPKFVARAHDHRVLRESLIGTVTAVCALGAFVALAVAAWPRLSIRLLFGGAYTDAAPMVRVLAASMVMLGAATIFLYYHLAIRSRASFIFWVASAVEVIAFILIHSSGLQIALIVAVIALAVLLLQSTTIPSLPPLESTDDELWGLPEPDHELTVVTPTFNAADFIPRNLSRLTEELDTTGLRFEIIVVSDGSTDRTPEVVRPLESANLHLVHYPIRKGKGEALRQGMRHARGEFIAFIDSDGDLNPKELAPFVDLMRAYNPDIVLGSKRHPMSIVEYPLLRRIMSWTYQVLLRTLFGLRVRDTQTGLKLLRRDVLAQALPRMLEKRFAFDLELLVVAKRLGYNRFFEAPVTLDYQFQSTVSPRAAVRILMDTAAIWYRRYILRHYDRAPAPSAAHDAAEPRPIATA